MKGLKLTLCGLVAASTLYATGCSASNTTVRSDSRARSPPVATVQNADTQFQTNCSSLIADTQTIDTKVESITDTRPVGEIYSQLPLLRTQEDYDSHDISMSTRTFFRPNKFYSIYKSDTLVQSLFSNYLNFDKILSKLIDGNEQNEELFGVGIYNNQITLSIKSNSELSNRYGNYAILILITNNQRTYLNKYLPEYTRR